MDAPSLPRRTEKTECDQGDFILIDTAFFVLTNDDNGDETIRSLETPTAGVAIITQVCDLRRDYVKVARVVDRSAAEYSGTNKRVGSDYDPRYANIENLPDGYFVDLDYVMLVSKAWLMEKDIIIGFHDLVLLRSFQRQLGRNLSRFGFPDAFNQAMKKLSDKLRKTRRRSGGMVGELAAKVKEILVYCDQNWSEGEGNIRFVLILEPEFEAQMDEVEATFIKTLNNFDKSVGPYQLAIADGVFDVVSETEETINLHDYRKGRRLDLGFVSYESDDPEEER